MIKEGHPVKVELHINEPLFYTFSVNDNTVNKVTIQLTTMHGDPNLFTFMNERPFYLQ